MSEHDMTNDPSTLDRLYPEHLTTHLRRIQDALERSGHDAVLIASGRQHVAFLDDMTYPFKVNPHFKALVPIVDNPESFILIRPGRTPQLFHHQPADYWHLPAADPSGAWTAAWEITPIGSAAEMHNQLGDVGRLAFIGEADAGAGLGIEDINPDALLDHVHFDRAYKTAYEIECIAAANRRAARGHLAARDAFEAGESEFGIQMAYLAATGERESQTPYSNIVALNEHCAVLHYQYYDRVPPAAHRSMLIDAGAGERGYAADITRTWARGDGPFPALVEAMDEAQRGIIDDIRIGMNYAELHQRAHERVAGLLVEFGLATMSAESLVETHSTFAFLPHGLGHLIGLQTHDVGGFQQDRDGNRRDAPEAWPALRLTRPVEAGQVFTIEPGLYFIPMLLKDLRASDHARDFNWHAIDALTPCGGIRIEDNVLVSEHGTRNLTREAFAAAAS